MLSHRQSFDNLFRADDAPVAVCATLRCDRRPAHGSRYCGCCRDDRREGRRVIACGADELLPFTREMARKNSAGPRPIMAKGDAAVREISENRARGAARGRGKFNPWTGDPARRTPPVHVH